MAYNHENVTIPDLQTIENVRVLSGLDPSVLPVMIVGPPPSDGLDTRLDREEVEKLVAIGVKFPTPYTMFKDRLRREGRFEQFEKTLAERYQDAKDQATMVGVELQPSDYGRMNMTLAREYGYVTAIRERRLYASYVLDTMSQVQDMLEKEEAARKREAKLEEQKHQRQHGKLAHVMPDADATSTFYDDVRWVYQQFAYVVRETDEGKIVYDLSKATTRAPSMGAIAMIRHASDPKNTSKMFEQFFKVLAKIDQGAAEAEQRIGASETREDERIQNLDDVRKAMQLSRAIIPPAH